MAKIFQTQKIPLDVTITKEERRRIGVRKWADIYRQNPHRAISTHFQCETLTWWQDMIIYLMFKSSVFFAIMTRGIGKSFLVAWFLVVFCTIQPRARVVIASGTRSQARLIVTQKILGEIYNRYPKVRQEIDIKNCGLGQNDTYVKFYNGSEIVVVTSSDTSRGNRCCVCIYEEARGIPQNTMRDIISKFKQNGDRRPRYKDNPKYMNYRSEEKKKDIYISSGWIQSHYLYNMTMDAYEAMLDGKTQVAISMHWGFPVVEGFMNYEDDILKEKETSDFSQMWWAIENEGLFWSESEKSIYGHQELTTLRKIEKPLMPIPDELYLDVKALKEWKKKNLIPKQQGEIRLLGCDVAIMGGANDNTVFTVLRLIPNGNRYKKYLSYVEHANNAHSETQSIRLKQLYNDFDIDICCLDCMGNGMSIADSASKLQYDSKRDIEYPAWTVFNREDMKDRVFEVNVEDAKAIIYGIKQDAKFNHFMITWLKSAVENGRLELLIDSNKARDNLEDRNLDESKITQLLKPFYETDILIKEMTALEVSTQTNSPYLKVDNPTMRKDRFSSLGFCNYYANILEQDLSKKTKKKSSFTCKYTPQSYFSKDNY